MASDLIADFFRQNEWANHQLLDVCRKLADEQLDATAVGSYGTIRDTLVHYLGAEERYIERLGGTLAGPRIGSEFPGFDTLDVAISANAESLIERAGATAGTSVARELRGGRYEIDAEVVLVQALNHSTEHRSQICTILTALGLQPPGLDGWTWGEAIGRMRRL